MQWYICIMQCNTRLTLALHSTCKELPLTLGNYLHVIGAIYHILDCSCHLWWSYIRVQSQRNSKNEKYY